MIRALIIENEQQAADELALRLKELFADVQVLGVYDTIDKSLQAIRTHAPDLVFLDVQLNNGETGFDILKQIAVVDFEVIFITAYDKFAIPAIKVSALDFLLKPYEKADLVAAIDRFKNNRTKFNQRHIDILFKNLKNPASQENTIAIPAAKAIDGYEFIKVNDIVYCKALSDYAEVYMKDQSKPNALVKRLVSRTLKECEALLTPYGFIRIHRSNLVNRQHILKYYTGKDKYVVLYGVPQLKISENFESSFLKAIGKL